MHFVQDEVDRLIRRTGVNSDPGRPQSGCERILQRRVRVVGESSLAASARAEASHGAELAEHDRAQLECREAGVQARDAGHPDDDLRLAGRGQLASKA